MENDDLPHKICFRCSAKVEELHEFVQKCVRTQESLQETIGKNKNVPKTKIMTQWQEKLNKSNISNDDICNALIKKAMEGIKDIPLSSIPIHESKPSSSQMTTTKTKGGVDSSIIANKEIPSDTNLTHSTEANTMFKKIKLSLEKCDTKSELVKCLRSKNSDGENEKNIIYDKINEVEVTKIVLNNDQKVNSKIDIPKVEESNLKIRIKEPSVENKTQKEDSAKTRPFNIMDHITTIKVNGVGILFQCKLCNRNFLKKEVVEVHACAKKGVIKQNIPEPLPLPEPPKTLNSVKYIDSKRTSEANKSIKIASDTNKESLLVPKKSSGTGITSDNKTKPKIGPASKVKRDNVEPQGDKELDVENLHALNAPKTNSETNSSNPNHLEVPIVNFPSIPSLASRYKLVTGPNNSLTLVENPVRARKLKRNPDEDNMKKNVDDVSAPVVIDLDDDNDKQSSSKEQPYPVGLFSTRPHNPNTNATPANLEVSKFTTPAMKKQSYTVVQTGNPSKLVISTKQAPVDDIPKKRSKKTKTDTTPTSDGAVKEPFSVTLEDVAHTKDPGFFTFINVDPLLQPSYVLPTDSIIQESQISTSTPAISNDSQSKDKDKYQCNICNLTFSREKKMLTHIQSHYSKLDEEEDMQEEINQNKRRKRKS